MIRQEAWYREADSRKLKKLEQAALRGGSEELHEYLRYVERLGVEPSWKILTTERIENDPRLRVLFVRNTQKPLLEQDSPLWKFFWFWVNDTGRINKVSWETATQTPEVDHSPKRVWWNLDLWHATDRPDDTPESSNWHGTAIELVNWLREEAYRYYPEGSGLGSRNTPHFATTHGYLDLGDLPKDWQEAVLNWHRGIGWEI